MIIIEGMDNTGKTTLCNRLAARYENVPIIHSEKPASNADALLKVVDLLRATKPAIYDRITAISEHVYGPVCRNHCLVPLAQIESLRLVAMTNMLVVHCRPPTDKILDFGQREQMPGVIERSMQLIEGYDRAMAMLRLVSFDTRTQVFIYDYTKDEFCWPLLAALADASYLLQAARHSYADLLNQMSPGA